MDPIERKDALDTLEKIPVREFKKSDGLLDALVSIGQVYEELKQLPPAQPQYTELTPEEAASEIASGSIMSASYWLDAMIRLKQMGYAICRKKEDR